MKQIRALLRPGVRVVLAAALLALPSFASASLGPSAGTYAADSHAFVRVARVLEPDRTGIVDPAGVAFSGRTDAFYVLSGGGATSPAVVSKLTPLGIPAGSVRLPPGVPESANVAYDARHQRLLVLASRTVLFAVPEEEGRLDVEHAARVDVGELGIRQPRGLAADPQTGRLFILDSGAGARIIRVDGAPNGDVLGPDASSVPLQVDGASDARGLSLDPSTGNLQLLSPSRRALFEVTQNGELVATRDLTSFQLRRPEGLVVGPSGDATDDPSQMSVYVADEGAGAATPGGIVELSLAAPTTTASVSFRSSLVRTTDTSTWSPPSPDPSGLAYLPLSRTLMMVDGEVEETVSGITHFAGANAWEMTLGGGVIRTANISKVAPTVVPMTNEPTGVAWNPANNHYYVSDDSALRVYDDNPGGDGSFGTADDTWTSFDTSPGGSGDPEGIAYDSWHDRIFVADGVNAEIYEFTTSGTPVRHFDVQQYGVVDPESVEFNADSGTLFVLSNHANPVIVETTTSGTLLQTIDYSAAPQVAPAGLAYAPASNGSTAKRFYVVDRGVDNNSDPRIVDGKMFELTAPTASTPGNLPPTVNAGPDQAVELPNRAVLDATVTDDGLPNPPGAVTTEWTQESGPGTVTFTNPAAVDTTASFSSIGTYVLRLTATDGEASGVDELTVTVSGAGGTSAMDVRVGAGSDDAEESASGTVSLTSTDLELVFDGSNQVVGIRFNGVTIPKGAPIVNAYIQFTVDEVSTGAAALTVAGFATDNLTTFTTATRDVSNRARTGASVAWSPADWPTVGEAGAAQRTPNLGAIIQEIVSRPGWSSGNSLGLVISGTGHRTAESFEKSPGGAPLLHIEYGGSVPPPTNTAPTVSIDPVAPVTLPAGANATGHVTDDGLPNPPAATTLSWTKQSGPGTVTFGSPTAATTTASFSAAGTYVLRLTADDGAFSSFAEATVVVNPSPTNTAPSVSIDPVAPVTLPAGTSLAGHVTDDGLPNPPGATTLTWTTQSGPGTVTFGSPTAATTTASFSAAGTYVLRLTADDSALSSFAEATVTVNPQPPPNTAPGVSIDPVAPVTLPAGTSLAGHVTDDGLPNPPAATTLSWTKQSGPGTVTFGSPTAATTTASFSAAGTYVLRLSASDSVLSGFADVSVIVNPEPPIFVDGFESGDLSAWSSSTTGNGDLSVTAAAALVGARGLQAVVNDNLPIYVTDESPQAEPRYHARFWFDPNSIRMAKNDVHTLFAAGDASSATVVTIELRLAGGRYQLRPNLLNDAGTSTSGASTRITDAPHAVELYWHAATAAGANDGGLTLWVDGVQVVSLAGVDNDTRRVERVSLGAVAGIDSGTRGTEYFDAFEARRNTYIGP